MYLFDRYIEISQIIAYNAIYVMRRIPVKGILLTIFGTISSPPDLGSREVILKERDAEIPGRGCVLGMFHIGICPRLRCFNVAFFLAALSDNIKVLFK